MAHTGDTLESPGNPADEAAKKACGDLFKFVIAEGMNVGGGHDVEGVDVRWCSLVERQHSISAIHGHLKRQLSGYAALHLKATSSRTVRRLKMIQPACRCSPSTLFRR